MATLECLLSLGFTSHPIKSSFLSWQNITILGLGKWTWNFTNEKNARTKKLSENLLVGVTSVRALEKFLVNIFDAFETVPYSRLFYRCLEFYKTKSLKPSLRNIDTMYLTLQEDTKDIILMEG